MTVITVIKELEVMISNHSDSYSNYSF